MNQKRAFTLMEAMVAMAIAGIISVAATSAMSLVLRTVSTTRNNMTVATNLNNSLQFISRDVEVAGGQGLAGQASFIVENDDCVARDGLPACNGSDRVHVFTALPEPPVCTVRAAQTAGALSFQYVQGGCCFPSMFSGAPVSGPIVLTRTDGAFRPVLATGISSTVCEFTVEDLLDVTLYLNDPVPATHEAVSLTDFTPFLGGQATLVTMRTYYLSQGLNPQGERFSELRGRTGAGPSATDALIMDEIWDFQVAVGVDVNQNKVVANDEWAFRGNDGIASDAYALRRSPPRLVQVAIVQGLKASVSNTVTVPLRTGNQAITEPGRLLRSGIVQLVPINATLGVLQ